MYSNVGYQLVNVKTLSEDERKLFCEGNSNDGWTDFLHGTMS